MIQPSSEMMVQTWEVKKKLCDYKGRHDHTRTFGSPSEVYPEPFLNYLVIVPSQGQLTKKHKRCLMRGRKKRGEIGYFSLMHWKRIDQNRVEQYK